MSNKKDFALNPDGSIQDLGEARAMMMEDDEEEEERKRLEEIRKKQSESPNKDFYKDA